MAEYPGEQGPSEIELWQDAEILSIFESSCCISQLKKFAVTCIASQLSGKEIQKMGNLFKQIDTNSDGFITTKELKYALDRQKDRTTLQEIEKMMKFVDTDHNGKLNYIEFIACCLENSVIFKEQNLQNVFKALDADGNGLVSREELKKSLTCNFT